MIPILIKKENNINTFINKIKERLIKIVLLNKWKIISQVICYDGVCTTMTLLPVTPIECTHTIWNE